MRGGSGKRHSTLNTELATITSKSEATGAVFRTATIAAVVIGSAIIQPGDQFSPMRWSAGLGEGSRRAAQESGTTHIGLSPLDPSLLVVASGYLFSGLIVVAHALAFPGAFSPTGVLGSGLQSAVWLYWFWHSGLPLAIIGYALLKDTDRVEADVRYTRRAISLSVAGVFALVIGLFWFVTQHEHLLPITFV